MNPFRHFDRIGPSQGLYQHTTSEHEDRNINQKVYKEGY